MFGPGAVCVSDRAAARQILSAWRRSGGEARRFLRIDGGESAKTFATAESLCDRIARLGIDRRTTLVAAGGGTVGDLTGFCASVLLRGLRVIAIPTTLTAQVDSAIGGKTALDLPSGKNLVGTFHHAAAVLIDPSCLRTLPARHLRQGWAEIVKCAILEGGRFWSLVEAARGGIPSEAILARTIRAKVRRVQEDPEDRGVRRELNLGHTLGHAIEAGSGWRLAHGDAVAIGLLFAIHLSSERGLLRDLTLLARCEAVLERLGLAVRVPRGPTAAAIERFLARDKKRQAGSLRWILPLRAGQVAVLAGNPSRDHDALAGFLAGSSRREPFSR